MKLKKPHDRQVTDLSIRTGHAAIKASILDIDEMERQSGACGDDAVRLIELLLERDFAVCKEIVSSCPLSRGQTLFRNIKKGV